MKSAKRASAIETAAMDGAGAGGFDDFFQAATGIATGPFDYQRRLAGDAECRSRLINIPTGLGKTAAVVLAWLWNRTLNPQPSTLTSSQWPRRLVYCLPMRTLVEQTEREVSRWLTNLVAKAPELGIIGASLEDLEWLAAYAPVVLMGGEELVPAKREWDIHPEKSAILIGTQDMLLSRALNRGYAAGRARWAKDFALLNNGCLWVFDEVQLMSAGFATSLQLQAWREHGGMAPALPTFSWWMSATLEREWLASSIDFSPRTNTAWEAVEKEKHLLWNVDVKSKTESGRRLETLLAPGRKTLQSAPAARLKGEAGKETPSYIEQVAKAVTQQKQNFPGNTILVVVNTVRRACALAEKLEAEAPFLLHSRFRPRERKAWVTKLKTKRLIVATQVVEAGVDITSRVLFTELCPWPSFIQRCGRAARHPGEEADIYWLDVSKVPAPYSEGEMLAAKAQLEKLRDASLAGLRAHRDALTADEASGLLPYSPRFVPQSKDLHDFFDTTPDLTGADIDISRYIRDGKDHDVSVFWRDCSNIRPGKTPPKNRNWKPEHAELCPVPVWADDGFREFAKKGTGRIWRWDYREGWTPLNRGDEERIFPGQVFLLEQPCGGYDPTKGWTGLAEDAEFEIGPWKAVPIQSDANEEGEDNPADSGDDVESSDGGSNSGQKGQWRTILAHSKEVCEDLEQQLQSLPLDPSADLDACVVLPVAVRLHDWGKAHIAFKHKVKPDELAKAASAVPDGLPAKAPDYCWRDKQKRQREDTPEAERDLRRAGFRHELASALAILELLRRHRPEHPALAWPDSELRAKFAAPPAEASEPLADSALADEIAALTASQFNLLIYLVAAHHGKVRMSLRSSPDDLRDDVPWPCPPKVKQARGVRDGDALPSVALPAADFASAQVSAPATTLRLDVMELGLSLTYGPSWRERAGALLAQHGPFRLAWYETLLRIADARASALASSGDVAHSMKRELAEHHRPLAETPTAGQSPPPLGNHPGAGGPEHGLRGRAGEPANPSRDTRPERATRFIETTHGVLSYSQLAPLLAGQVVAVQADIERGVYGPRALEESLLLEFHRRIAGDLVPEWAGRWRAIAVRVGNLQPPPPHAVPVRMHDYGLDLQARWPAAAASLGDLTLEFLAFAEGRFLTVHPFQDFNGRVIRLFLSELLRRLDLPPVRLEAEGESERAAYFGALEAADQNDLRPLIEFWKQRLAASEPQTA